LGDTQFDLGVDGSLDLFKFYNSGNFTAGGNVAGATYGSDASVSNTELLYINTLSSNAQTQLNSKSASFTTIAGLNAILTGEDVASTTWAGASSLVTVGTLTSGALGAGFTAVNVAQGGTGASTLTDHGVLVGSGTGAVTALTVGTNGQLLIGSTGADPVFATLDCNNGLGCTIGAGTLTIDFDGGASPGGSLGGTWASPTIDDLFLLNNGDIGTGVFDFGGATSFEMVNGAASAVDAIGEFALDTTDNQLIIATSTAHEAVVRTNEKIFGFSLASTSPEWFSGGSLPVPPEKDGYIITGYNCYVTAGTSVVLTPSDGTNDMDAITCATTITADTSISKNSTVTAGELMQMKIGAITGAVDYVSFTAYGTWTRE
jgi:hypothetical protein